MRGRNNLGQGYHSTYWKVSRGFKVFARVAHLDDLKRGSLSRPIPVYEAIKLKAGDQILDLHGGVYAAFKAGGCCRIKIKMGLGFKTEEIFPLSCLKSIKEDDAIVPESYVNGEFYNFLTLAKIAEQGLFLDR